MSPSCRSLGIRGEKTGHEREISGDRQLDKVSILLQGQDGLGRVWESEFRAENKGGPLSPFSG